MDVKNVLTFAANVAQEAGALLLEGFYSAKEVTHKSSTVDLVTQYDTAAETLIVERIAAMFPEHGLIGEEGSARIGSSDFHWIIDPLDGTTNFSHGFPVWCISIALYKGERPYLAVIYDPTRDELFQAVAGAGATLIGRNGHKFKLGVSTTENLNTALLATGFPYDRHTSNIDNTMEVRAFVKRVQGIRRAGSAALDLCYVAAGRLDGYWEYKLQPWDVAAGMLIVQEAGGTLSDFEGKPPGLEKQMSLLGSNGRIHQAMLDVLSNIQAT